MARSSTRRDQTLMPQPSAPGRVAGIDYGTVRVGVAVSDANRTLASPLETYTRRGESADAGFFRQLVEREEIRLFVVGLPVHLSGEESEKSHEARRFGAWLAEVTGLAVEYYDERFSSVQADSFLHAGKLTRQRRKQRRDMLAAQVMLAAYLESGRSSRRNRPGALERLPTRPESPICPSKSIRFPTTRDKVGWDCSKSRPACSNRSTKDPLAIDS